MIAVGDWTANSGEEGLYHVLEREPGIDAIFASNDQMAPRFVILVRHRLAERTWQESQAGASPTDDHPPRTAEVRIGHVDLEHQDQEPRGPSATRAVHHD